VFTWRAPSPATSLRLPAKTGTPSLRRISKSRSSGGSGDAPISISWSLRFIDEVQTGDPTLAKSRLEIVDSLPRLRVTGQVTDLALKILSKGLLPQKAFPDALHIATATVHQIEYLLTWNCKHIANLEVLPRIADLCEDLGLRLPIICTPEELLGVANDQ